MPRHPRNRRPDLNGVLVIDKPIGPSSFGVCRQIRRQSGGAKVGHAGALDPLASGVLVVCLGSATKAVEQLMASEKRYQSRMDLSAFSTTDDREGEFSTVEVAQPPSRQRVEEACQRFIGVIMQRPPIYSAAHVSGERAYKLARRGELTRRPEPRPVVIHSIDLLDFAWPIAMLDIRCGKGTYIRSLARDLGRSLGIGGHLASLRRTEVGPFTLAAAIALDEIPEPMTPEHLLPIPQRVDRPAGPVSIDERVNTPTCD